MLTKNKENNVFIDNKHNKNFSSYIITLKSFSKLVSLTKTLKILKTKLKSLKTFFRNVFKT